MTFLPSFLASSITSDLFLIFVSHAGIFSSFSYSLSTAALLVVTSLLEALEQTRVPNRTTVVSCPFFLRYGPHDISVKVLPFAFLWIHWLPRYMQT